MSATNRGGKRIPDDVYVTTPWSVDRLLDRRVLPRGGVWYEPCAGDGAIIRAVQRYGYDVKTWLATELRVSAELHLQHTILRHCPPMSMYSIESYLLPEQQKDMKLAKVDVIITNPPFYLARPVIERAKQHARYVAMQLRLDFFGSAARQPWLASCMPDCYVLPNRPSYGLNKHGKRGSDSNEYAWFIWTPERGRREGKVVLLDTTPDDVRRACTLAREADVRENLRRASLAWSDQREHLRSRSKSHQGGKRAA